jgi:hypothetical protein
MMRSVSVAAKLFALLALLASGLTSACVPPSSPGMAPCEPRPDPTSPARDVVARAQPPAGHRTVLVAYPRTAYSGSARIVFVDDAGGYLGAVGPGEGALLVVPLTSPRIRAFSSIELGAPVGAWFTLSEIHLALTEPASGILLRPFSNGQFADVAIVKKARLEEILGATEIRWFEPRLEEGRAWLASHQSRVGDILADRTPAVKVENEFSDRPSRVYRRTRLP